MTRETILEDNIEYEVWPEPVLAMTYIKNNWTTRALQDNISLYKVYSKEAPNILLIFDYIALPYTYYSAKKNARWDLKCGHKRNWKKY